MASRDNLTRRTAEQKFTPRRMPVAAHGQEIRPRIGGDGQQLTPHAETSSIRYVQMLCLDIVPSEIADNGLRTFLMLIADRQHQSLACGTEKR